MTKKATNKSVLKKNGSKVIKEKDKNPGKGDKSIAPLELLNQTLDAVMEYKTVKEKEITKRKNIKAKKEVALEKIRSQKEVLMKSLDLTFDERRENFNRFFDALDKGIENNDIELVDRALHGIVTIAKVNPFKSFQDFQDNFYNDDTVIDI